MRIVIGSAGRRVYLIHWFLEAAAELGLDVDVVVLENDPDAATVAVASEYRIMPRYDSGKFGQVLVDTVVDAGADLYFSLNDYELDILANGVADELRAAGTLTLSLTSERQGLVADKLAMCQLLIELGVPTPTTVELSDLDGVRALVVGQDRVVVKDRHGSGSSGFAVVASNDVIEMAVGLRSARGHDRAAGRRLIVQRMVNGAEHGLDVICGLDGGPMTGLLVRRKLAMKNGETASAVTVPVTGFRALGETIASALQHQGLIDIDVIVMPSGEIQVIDINPRFGGGYPFSHIAGAEVPGYYLSQLAGIPPPAGWSDYRVGVRAAKHEAIVSFDR